MIRVATFTEDQHRPALVEFFTSESGKRFTPTYYDNDVLLKQNFERELPHVILSVSSAPCHSAFPQLGEMPVYMKRRWLHKSDPADVSAELLAHCNFSEIMCKDETNPLVSLFTTSFKSGSKILRPFKSLLAQTYREWEWVVLCDSEGDANYEMLVELAKQDYRIKVFNSKHTGMIGTGKRRVAMMCTGSILLEFDHDDEIAPDALQRIVDVKEPWDFLSSSWCEPFEDNPAQTVAYESGWGYGW
jgi:hypothetical protein